jgi:transcriptional regulator with XRE-family HTH domain
VILAATDNVSMAKLSPKRRRAARHYVRQWREYRGLTQEQLAERVGKSRGLISQIEAASTDLDIADALRGQPADIQAEALGFVRGLTRKG